MHIGPRASLHAPVRGARRVGCRQNCTKVNRRAVQRPLLKGTNARGLPGPRCPWSVTWGASLAGPHHRTPSIYTIQHRHLERHRTPTGVHRAPGRGPGTMQDPRGQVIGSLQPPSCNPVPGRPVPTGPTVTLIGTFGGYGCNVSSARKSNGCNVRNG